MAWATGGDKITHMTAASTMASNQYKFVKKSGATTFALCATAGEAGLGVLQDAPASGAGEIQVGGISKVVLGGTVTAGDALTCDANGDAVTSTLASDYIFGRALVSGVDNDLIPLLLTQEGAKTTRYLTIPITLANLSAADVLTAMTLTGSGKITAVEFFVTTAVTTGSKAATLNLEIGTTDLTGGAVALTSANCTPLGAKVAGSAITAANTFVNGDTLSIEAASVTTFSEGAGVLVITIQ